MKFRLLLIALGAATLGACSRSPEAPADRGVCWHVVQMKDGKLRFNKLAANQPSIEYCAAQLEHMRTKFLALGGSVTEITGAYQGQYIFIDKRGVFTASSLDTTPFLLLVRTGDGRLAVPGAMPQPPDEPEQTGPRTIQVPPAPH